MSPPSIEAIDRLAFTPNPSYERYLRMHKVFVGNHGAEQLEEIHRSLRNETMPCYLSVAGWAAVEASLVRSDKPTQDRLGLLGDAAICWQKSLRQQLKLNEIDAGQLTESDYAY